MDYEDHLQLAVALAEIIPPEWRCSLGRNDYGVDAVLLEFEHIDDGWMLEGGSDEWVLDSVKRITESYQWN